MKDEYKHKDEEVLKEIDLCLMLIKSEERIMTMLDECIKTLGNPIQLLNNDKAHIIKRFSERVPLTLKGKIDWNEIVDKDVCNSEEELRQICTEGDYYIIWKNSKLPVLKTSLSNITHDENIYSIIEMGVNAYLMSEDFTNIIEIEFHRNGEITYNRFSTVDNSLRINHEDIYEHKKTSGLKKYLSLIKKCFK